MSDYISREKAIKSICQYGTAQEKIGRYAVTISELKQTVADTLSDLPSADVRENRWIPVSERLPEMGVRVLCACQADLYDVLKLTPNGWFYDTRHTYMLGFVRAWQPLPEPYMKGGE